jgi:hypothetical protein
VSLSCYGLETANLIDCGNWVSCFGRYQVVSLSVAGVIKSPKAFGKLNEKVEFFLLGF